MKNRLSILNVSIIAALGGAGSGPVLAQQPSSEAALEEVVVTATRRTQSLQDVPIAIMALTGDDLEIQGIETIEGLQGTIPNLSVVGGTNGSAFSTNFSIRGIPRVGFYVDGIWLPYNTGLAEFSLADVERIEVLRGPQGTLYGRDSTGGSIRVVTKEPEDEFGGTASVNMGSYNRKDAMLSVNIPLAENLRTRFSATSENRDGYVRSNALNESLGQIDMYNIAADLMWTPTDRFDLRVKYNELEDHTEDGRITLWHVPQGANLVGFEYGATGLYTLAGAQYDSETVVAGYPGGDLGEWESNLGDWIPGTTEVSQASVVMNLDLTDAVTMTSQTGYVDFYRATLLDWDNSQWETVETYSANENKLFSQEIQFTGSHGRFDWVSGVYYWNEAARTRGVTWGFEEFKDGRLDRDAVLATPECMAPTDLAPCDVVFGIYQGIGSGNSLTETTEEGYAVFGEVVVGLTDQLNLTVGARYHEQDIANRPMALIPGLSATRPARPGPFTDGDVFAGSFLPDNFIDTTFDSVTTRVALDYSFTDSIMGYVSYSEGFNAGGASSVSGFINNAEQRVLIPFDPEDIQTFEIGVRSDLMDGRLRLNATLFHTDWEDIQLRSNYVDPNIGLYAITIITQNVAGADADGIEAEIAWLATDNLELNLNFGLLDTAYTTFKQGDETPVNSGDAFAQAPEETYSIGLQHTASLSSGTLTTRLDYSYVSGFQRYADPKYHPDFLGLTDLLGEYEAGDYGLVNARLVYAPDVGNWEFALYGTNLTDEMVINGGFYGSIWEADWSTVSRPREAGVQLKIVF